MRLLLGLPAVGEVREDGWGRGESAGLRDATGRRALTRNLVRGAALACGDHDEQLHDGVVDLWAAGLNDEDVLLSHAREDPHAGLALCIAVSQSRRDAMTAPGRGQRRARGKMGSRAGSMASTAVPKRPGEQRRIVSQLTLENWVSSASAGLMPKFSQIWPVRTGHELPAKIRVPRMVVGGKRKRKEAGGRSVGRSVVALLWSAQWGWERRETWTEKRSGEEKRFRSAKLRKNSA